MDEYSTEPGVDRMMITEATDSQVDKLMRYYGLYGEREADFPMNFGFMLLEDKSDVGFIWQKIQDWLETMPAEATANWIISSHDKPRVLSRIGLSQVENDDSTDLNGRYAKIIALLMMTMPGTPFIYYGQELGMTDLTIEEYPRECWEDIQVMISTKSDQTLYFILRENHAKELVVQCDGMTPIILDFHLVKMKMMILVILVHGSQLETHHKLMPKLKKIHKTQFIPITNGLLKARYYMGHIIDQY